MIHWDFELTLAISAKASEPLAEGLVERARRVQDAFHAMKRFAGDDHVLADVLSHLEAIESTVRRARACFPLTETDDAEDDQ